MERKKEVSVRLCFMWRFLVYGSLLAFVFGFVLGVAADLFSVLPVILERPTLLWTVALIASASVTLPASLLAIRQASRNGLSGCEP